MVQTPPDVAGHRLAAPGVADGPAEVLARPSDLQWLPEGAGIPAEILRVIDRADGRRLLALTESGEAVELDVDPEVAARPRDRGVVQVRRARVFAA